MLAATVEIRFRYVPKKNERAARGVDSALNTTVVFLNYLHNKKGLRSSERFFVEIIIVYAVANVSLSR